MNVNQNIDVRWMGFISNFGYKKIEVFSSSSSSEEVNFIPSGLQCKRLVNFMFPSKQHTCIMHYLLRISRILHSKCSWGGCYFFQSRGLTKQRMKQAFQISAQDNHIHASLKCQFINKILLTAGGCGVAFCCRWWCCFQYLR